jgi:hypothetical protein
MIDGNRCYSVMSELEQRRWQKAVINEQFTNINFLLNQKYWTFEEFIGQSFVWEATNQGHDYWEGISKKYIVHDMLSPQKRFSGGKPFEPFI